MKIQPDREGGDELLKAIDVIRSLAFSIKGMHAEVPQIIQACILIEQHIRARPTTTQQAAGDERAAFEQWYYSDTAPFDREDCSPYQVGLAAWRESIIVKYAFLDFAKLFAIAHCDDPQSIKLIRMIDMSQASRAQPHGSKVSCGEDVESLRVFKRNTEAMLYLMGEDVAFMGANWSDEVATKGYSAECYLGTVGCLLMNDTFHYASADAEEVPYNEWPHVKEVYEKWGEEGLIAWVALRRGYDPAVSGVVTDKFKQAKQALARHEQQTQNTGGGDE